LQKGYPVRGSSPAEASAAKTTKVASHAAAVSSTSGEAKQ